MPKLEKKPYLNQHRWTSVNALRRRENHVEGTRQIASVTSE